MHSTTILVPTDFSDCANSAIPTAIACAEAMNAEVVLLHVMELPMQYAGIGLNAESLVGLQADIHHQVDRELETLRASCGSEIPIRVQTRSGSAAHEIVLAARTEDAELIVMATHGYRGMRRWWLGSTTERVLATSPCPTLTVRADTSDVSTFRKILVPTDFSPDAHRAIPAALEIAERVHGAEIVLAHVETPNDYVAFDVALTTPATYHDDLAARLHELCDTIGERVTCRAVLLHGRKVEEELAEFAREDGVDLVVVSSHGHTGPKRFVLGSTTSRLACVAPSPVWTTRAETVIHE